MVSICHPRVGPCFPFSVRCAVLCSSAFPSNTRAVHSVLYVSGLSKGGFLFARSVPWPGCWLCRAEARASEFEKEPCLGTRMVLGAAQPSLNAKGTAGLHEGGSWQCRGLGPQLPWELQPVGLAFLRVPQPPPPPPRPLLTPLFTLSFLSPVVSAQVLFLLAPVQLCGLPYCVLSVSKRPILVTLPSSDSGDRLDLVIFPLDLEYR